MDDFDDFDPEGQQRDSSKTIFMLLVLMAAMVVATTLLAPKPKPPEAKKPEGEKATTQVDAKAKPPSTASRLTTGLPPKGTTATPTKGGKEPEPPTKQPEPPRAPEHEIQPVELTRSSQLLCATFTNQDARLARLVLLDHYRTPVDKRAARRARRRDPNADLSPYGLPLLGQEQATALENGGFELGDTVPGSQETPTRPRDWNASETIGSALLWSQDARRGSRSVAIKDPTSDAAWATTVPGIEPGETYELVCWVKLDAEGTPETLLPSVKAIQQVSTKEGAAWKDDKGELHPAILELPVPRAAGWQRIEGRFIAEPATKQVQLLLRAPKGFKGQVWFDDLSLLKLGPDSLVLLEPKRAASEPLTADEQRLFASRRFQLASASENVVAFRATIPGASIEVTKTFILPKPDDPLQRHVTLEVQFRNLGDKEVKHPGYLLRGPGGLAADLTPASWKHGQTVPDPFERQTAADSLTTAVARLAPGGQINVPSKARAELKSLETGSKEVKPATWDEVGEVLWAAVAANYFVAILEPQAPTSQRLKLESGGARCLGTDKDNLASVVQVAPFVLGPKGKGDDAAVHRFRLFAGPKTADDLASYGANYERLFASRWLDPLTTACVWVLRASYFVIPNYGFAIFVLTALVRLVLHPLSKKSQTSMQKMQKLAPQVTELREKFKSDKKRLQEETMKLYKTYGVNPMGGCLPIVLQIPVFIGLWRALQESIELRHAPLDGYWIQDLSQPDALFGVVNILPIASCAIMFIQQKMTPKGGDPQQQQTQKIMGYIMPVFLGWILYGLPSGLGLYFIASTLVGIGEQRIIKRHMDRLGELKPVAEKPDKQARKFIFTKKPKQPKRRLF